MNVHVQKAVVYIQEGIIQGNIDVNDPIALIEEIFKVIKSVMGDLNEGEYIKHIALEAIKRIAAGADGIAGTDDDLIPVDVVQKISSLINSGVVTNIIDFVASHEAIIKVAAPCMKPFFGKLLMCFGGKKSLAKVGTTDSKTAAPH